MKNIIFKIFIALILSFGVLSASAQEKQQFVIPLSSPGKPGKLIVSQTSGSIIVRGYKGKDVIVEASPEQDHHHNNDCRKCDDDDDYDYDDDHDDDDDDDDDDRIKRGKHGLKKIANNAMDLSAEESNNTVRIKTNSWKRSVYLEIKVPENFDLNLKGINDGGIKVENVNGEMEIGHTNDDIILIDISGSAVVNTTNGDVKVIFKKVTQDVSMAFSSFNGDIDVSFPKDIKADLKMKTEMGEIYTDFDVIISKTKPIVEKSNTRNATKIKMEQWVYGKINNGGPEILFKTYNGDIIIRRND